MAQQKESSEFIFSHGSYRGKFLNLTPHCVKLFIMDFAVEFPSSGFIRLLRTQNGQSKIECGISGDVSLTFEFPKFAPFTDYTLECDEPISDQALIVSMPVADYIISNNLFMDNAVLIPDTGPGSVIRDTNGNIVGVRKFIVYRIPMN